MTKQTQATALPNTRPAPKRRNTARDTTRPDRLRFHLEDILTQRGLNLPQAETLTGIPKTTLHSWISGDSALPSAPMLVKLCDGLKLTIGELISLAPPA